MTGGPRFRVVAAPVSAALQSRMFVDVDADGVARLSVDDKTVAFAASMRELQESLGLVLRRD